MLALNLRVSIDSKNNHDQQGPRIPPNIRQISRGLTGAVGSLGAVGRPGAVVHPGAVGPPGAVGSLEAYFFSHTGEYLGDSNVPTISTSPPQNCRPTFVCENINTTKQGIVNSQIFHIFYYMIGAHS